MKILVIQQKMIGDVLTSTIICENLKKNYPKANVHYLINRFTLPVVKENPYIDKIIFFEDTFRENKWNFYDFLKQISKEKYTHVVDAYAKLESLLVTIFSKAQKKYGFKKFFTNQFYTKTVEISITSTTEAGSAIENRIKLLKLFSDVKVYTQKPKIYFHKKELDNAKHKLYAAGLIDKSCIMVSALGSNDSKTYPLDYMAIILDAIVSNTQSKLLLNYMPSQHKQIETLIAHCHPNTKKSIFLDIDMHNLRDFITVCYHCRAIIGNEGGAINIAKAIDVPSFSIFSPWVIKEGWNSFEDSYYNTSVHLSDFELDFYASNSLKLIKDNVKDYYKKLKPELFMDSLINFLSTLED